MDGFWNRSRSVQAEMRAMPRIYMLWHSAHLLLTLMILPTVLANGKGTCSFQGRGQVASILALSTFWVQSRCTLTSRGHHSKGCIAGLCDKVGTGCQLCCSRGAGVGFPRDRLQVISDQR
ncbi:uncharacterized protein HD556DRAFT_1373678 [Suillus plorans]|uniref:Secreted protein n=1 Tax=Suillus plorans TaxID=116603 RepID=A0A9P7APC8_9AGAM|nr:uncharacterized protein HD556DRAFT_1373678 [Suillus plorans]KAG1793702.1 hypothetical protein HD556DRAFT_1373678 [Suillus plorans]